MSVALVDYGVGNILSVARAAQAVSNDLVVTADRDTIARADHVIVPGVGSFAACMTRLDDHGLRDFLCEISHEGRPMLGICVGMQMLFESSSEFGQHEGLGLIPGHVTRIAEHAPDGKPVKIPHIGWNALSRPSTRDSWVDTVLEPVTHGEHFYFLHSFAGFPSIAEHILAETQYYGHALTAVVGTRRTFGVQFHPEKSGPAGLALLRRFVSL